MGTGTNNFMRGGDGDRKLSPCHSLNASPISHKPEGPKCPDICKLETDCIYFTYKTIYK